MGKKDQIEISNYACECWATFFMNKKKYQIPKSKWNDIKLHYVVENVWSCQNMLYTENGSASGEQATQKIPKYSATD